jgi:predicted RNase H-like HicB family nuclease
MNYHINIYYSEEDGGYIADVPDLEFCSAFGSTPAEALAELEKAKSAWLETAKAKGKPIPEPKYRPAIYQIAS